MFDISPSELKKIIDNSTSETNQASPDMKQLEQLQKHNLKLVNALIHARELFHFNAQRQMKKDVSIDSLREAMRYIEAAVIAEEAIKG